jgi:hypothetical protein
MKIKYLNSQLILLATNDPVIDQSNEIKSEEIIKPFDWNAVVQKMNK